MIPAPNLGQRWDSIAVNPATVVPRDQTQQTARAPEPNEVLLVRGEAPEAVPPTPLELIKIRADLQLEDITMAFEGSATVGAAPGEEFVLDLSFMYFNVVVIGNDGTVHQLNSSGDSMTMSLGTGEMALLLSPGSRSNGTGYLEAVRRIAAEVARVARQTAPRHGNDRVVSGETKAAADAAQRSAHMGAAQQTPSSKKPTPASTAAVAETRPNPTAAAVAKAFTSFAALVNVRSTHTNAAAGTTAVYRDSHNHGAATRVNVDSGVSVNMHDRRKLHLIFEESDLRGELSITRQMLADASGSPSIYIDQTV